jgi:hypothetical protein
MDDMCDLYFDLYDLDGSGTVSKSEIAAMLASTREFSEGKRHVCARGWISIHVCV